MILILINKVLINMTKKDAEKIFNENFLTESNKKDKILIKTEQNNFTDSLCKDGQISEKQYNNWDYPRFCK